MHLCLSKNHWQYQGQLTILTTEATFCPLGSYKFCPLHIPFISQSLYFIPLFHTLYFISCNTIFSLFASKASKQNIHKALWEEIESRREKSEGCQHCQANTHLQSASHHRNTAVTTSVNVFSYAQKFDMDCLVLI